MFKKTLAEIRDQILAQASEYGVVLDTESWSQIINCDPVQYEEVRRIDVPIQTLKGKNTKKWFHVVITRFGLNDGALMGKYELVCYPL